MALKKVDSPFSSTTKGGPGYPQKNDTTHPFRTSPPPLKRPRAAPPLRQAPLPHQGLRLLGRGAEAAAQAPGEGPLAAQGHGLREVLPRVVSVWR